MVDVEFVVGFGVRGGGLVLIGCTIKLKKTWTKK